MAVHLTFTYDKRGNRVAEAGKKANGAYVYDATNHLVEGTNWQGDKSAYQYNGLFVRVRNTQTTHSGQVYDREFVIDYNSFERNDLMVFSAGYYEQKHIYTAWGERMEQFTERGSWDRLLYVHEDIMGNTRYYTKDNGQSFAELEYDVWGGGDQSWQADEQRQREFCGGCLYRASLRYSCWASTSPRRGSMTPSIGSGWPVTP